MPEDFLVMIKLLEILKEASRKRAIFLQPQKIMLFMSVIKKKGHFKVFVF